ncbi:MAG: hypothetical protein QM731_18705 [Chitinophagaceae bacterium]
MKKNLLFFIVATTIAGSAYSQKFTKEISQEVPATKGELVRVVSTSRKLDIKPWNQPKVKIIAVIASDSAIAAGTDENLFEAMGITVKPFSNRVDILSRSTTSMWVNDIGYDTRANVSRYKSSQGNTYTFNDVLVKSSASGNVTTAPRKPFIQSLTVMVPEEASLDIDQRYGDVYIGTNVANASIEINNGALDAQDIKSLKLKSTYSNVNLGNVETAEVEFYNGTLRAAQINDLDIDARSSSIDYTKGNYAYVRSQNDNISIDEIGKLDGRKSYGSIRIEKLNTSLELDGNNVDLKLRTISPTVELVKINNRYGDMRLPVRGLQNYAVTFEGKFSTVFAPFEKVAVKEETDDKDAKGSKTGDKKEAQGVAVTTDKLQDVTVISGSGQQVSGLYTTNTNGLKRALVGGQNNTYASSNTPAKFTSAAGDIKGKHTKFDLICSSCTVDFK